MLLVQSVKKLELTSASGEGSHSERYTIYYTDTSTVDGGFTVQEPGTVKPQLRQPTATAQRIINHHLKSPYAILSTFQ